MNATDNINVVFRKSAYSLMSRVTASSNSGKLSEAEDSAQSKTHKTTIRAGSALRSDQVACASVTIILKEMDRNIKMFI